MLNRYGQEILPGDFVIAAHVKGTSDFYIVKSLGAKKSRIMLKRFYIGTWDHDYINGKWIKLDSPRVELTSEDTFVNYPEYVFKVHSDEYKSIDPQVREAYLMERGKILSGTT